MKKTFITIILALSSLLVSAQPKEFYGLKLGEKVTREAVIAAVGEKGTFSEKSDSLELNNTVPLIAHAFSPIEYDGYNYLYGIFQTLQDGTLAFFGVGEEASEETPVAVVDSVFTTLKAKLFTAYPSMADMKTEEEGGVTRYMYPSIFGSTIRLDCTFENGQCASFELAYIDAMVLALEMYKEPERPTLQDTFFGLKFGDKATINQIKYAVGSKGSFSRTDYESNSIEHTFTDINFAGSKWDYGVFITTSSNELYWFTVYNSFPDGYSYSDDNKEAQRLYEYLKGKLDSKYGEGTEKKDEDGNLNTYYYGNNDIIAVVTNERSRSIGGSYRRYVKLLYVQQNLLSAQNKATDDEF